LSGVHAPSPTAVHGGIEKRSPVIATAPRRQWSSTHIISSSLRRRGPFLRSNDFAPVMARMYAEYEAKAELEPVI
jgi:hypothetical protein